MRVFSFFKFCTLRKVPFFFIRWRFCRRKKRKFTPRTKKKSRQATNTNESSCESSPQSPEKGAKTKRTLRRKHKGESYFFEIFALSLTFFRFFCSLLKHQNSAKPPFPPPRARVPLTPRATKQRQAPTRDFSNRFEARIRDFDGRNALHSLPSTQ